MYCVPVLVMIVAYSAIAIKLLLRKTPGNRHVTTQSNQDKNRRKVSSCRRHYHYPDPLINT